MKIALGADHGGYALKEEIKKMLERLGHTYEDFGCFSTDSCDYPDFGAAAARAVADGSCQMGIVVCTTGIGMSIVANKIPGIRCAHCADSVEAEMTRRHNNANMMAIGAGFTGRNMAERMVEAFLSTEFEGGRHARRVDKIAGGAQQLTAAPQWQGGNGCDTLERIPQLPGANAQVEGRFGCCAGAGDFGCRRLYGASGAYCL